MGSWIPVLGLIDEIASLRTIRILCVVFLVLGNLGLILTFQELTTVYIILFGTLINGGFIVLWKYYNWWFGLEELWEELVVMDDILKLIMMFLGFVLFLNILARILFNGIFGARVKESRINNKDNPNSKN
jgi:hypothetical protein